MSSTTNPAITVSCAEVGEFDGHTVVKYTLENANGVKVQLSNYAANITNIFLPDKHGNLADIVRSFESFEDYLIPENSHIGATIGRYANRIKNATFTLDGKTYQLPKNDGENTLHGGDNGLDKKFWNHRVDEDHRVVFSYVSPDGEEGFPETVTFIVKYCLTDKNQLILTMDGIPSGRTPINLTNHSYFNLSGYNSGKNGLDDHEITINAHFVTELDDTLCTTGKLSHVELDNQRYDFRTARNLREALNENPGGYDINFYVNDPRENAFVARVVSTKTGRSLEVHCNQPGVQFYTGDESAFCLETQNFPNAVNLSIFPDSVFSPESPYLHVVTYTFGIVS